jgi:hypothetical protein
MNETDMRQAVSPDKVWEGSYILDMFAKEDTSIRPETVHGDIRWNQTLGLLLIFLPFPFFPRKRMAAVTEDSASASPTSKNLYRSYLLFFCSCFAAELCAREAKPLLAVALFELRSPAL